MPLFERKRKIETEGNNSRKTKLLGGVALGTYVCEALAAVETQRFETAVAQHLDDLGVFLTLLLERQLAALVVILLRSSSAVLATLFQPTCQQTLFFITCSATRQPLFLKQSDCFTRNPRASPSQEPAATGFRRLDIASLPSRRWFGGGGVRSRSRKGGVLRPLLRVQTGSCVLVSYLSLVLRHVD
jgi:hypothetical protein